MNLDNIISGNRDTSADERPPGRDAKATLEDAPRPPVQKDLHQRRPNKVLSGSHLSTKQPVAGCFALCLGLPQSDPHQQSSNDTPAHIKTTLWGQLGEILGGVRFP